MRTTIAIIEDDRDILELLFEVFEAEGFRVIAFSTPDVARISGIVPSSTLFLIDLMLPGINGVELASRLREATFYDSPMIAMSASRLMLEVAAGSGLFEGTVAKPFNLSTLLQAVEECSALMPTGPRHSVA
jgi:two-component system alkaline phosphatase synthesis response regulator PhoP